MDIADRQKTLSKLAEARSDLLQAYGKILRQKEDLSNALWLASEAGVPPKGVILVDGLQLSVQNLEMLATQASDELNRTRNCIDEIGLKIAQMQPN